MKPLSVLVVDDVAELRSLISLVLSGMGHAVACAATGQEAAKYLRNHPCDLVIADILMPDGDGLELIREVRHLDESVRILAMSGGGTVMDPKLCLKMATGLGAHATLHKPFDAEQLRRGVEAALVA